MKRTVEEITRIGDIALKALKLGFKIRLEHDKIYVLRELGGKEWKKTKAN